VLRNILGLCFVVVVHGCLDKLKKRLMYHTSFKIYLTSMSFYVFYLFIECIAYGQFANTGVPNDVVKTFGRYLKK
jgi:hypothetical protein